MQPLSRPGPPSALTPDHRLVGSVLLCPSCGRVEVRLGGARFTLDPRDVPLILDQIDDLEDRGGPALALRFIVGIGRPRTELDLSWRGVEALRLLLLKALDEIDRGEPPRPGGSNRCSPSLN